MDAHKKVCKLKNVYLVIITDNDDVDDDDDAYIKMFPATNDKSMDQSVY